MLDYFTLEAYCDQRWEFYGTLYSSVFLRFDNQLCRFNSNLFAHKGIKSHSAATYITCLHIYTGIKLTIH